MRFYQDDCERLLDVNWYFVERTDFVPSTAYCSSVYDEEPDMEGLPVGELAATREHRTGTIPPGTGITRQYKGTSEQWAGAVNVADHVRPWDVCGPVETECQWAAQSVLQSQFDPCADLYPGNPKWNATGAPTVTFNGQAYAMQPGPFVALPGVDCGANAFVPSLPCPNYPEVPFWAVAVEMPPSFGFTGNVGLFVVFVWGSSVLLRGDIPCPLGYFLAVYGIYYGAEVDPPCAIANGTNGFVYWSILPDYQFSYDPAGNLSMSATLNVYLSLESKFLQFPVGLYQPAGGC